MKWPKEAARRSWEAARRVRVASGEGSSQRGRQSTGPVESGFSLMGLWTLATISLVMKIYLRYHVDIVSCNKMSQVINL